ncbi:MAG: DMT family transporter [Bacteroidales bacterium]|nr:DMT family transporter [Bacteroidales bacterium]
MSKIALPPKTKGVLLVLVANIFFAINMPVSRELTPDWIDPFGLSQLRITFAFIAFLILSLFIKDNTRNFSIKEHLILITAGITGTAANQLSFLTGLSMTSPVDASLIITIGPIITMLFSALIIKEPISMKKISGVLIGMSGAAIILYTAKFGNFEQTGTLKGNLIILISGCVYAFYLVIIRPVMAKHSAIHVMKWTFFYGALIALPYTWKKLTISPGATSTEWFQLGYALLMGTFVAYLLVAFSLKLLRPTTVSMFNYVQPLVASSIAIIIGQDIFNWTKPVSATLIFTGVYLVIKSKSRSDLEKSRN